MGAGRGARDRCHHCLWCAHCAAHAARQSRARCRLSCAVAVPLPLPPAGMGINKLDVRFIVHHTLSKSIDAYYQESGRAGRDGLPATCLLLYRPLDVPRVIGLVCRETHGTAQLHRLAAYCESETLCRRAILAAHFDEGDSVTWRECGAGCDVCIAAAAAREAGDGTQAAAGATAGCDEVTRQMLCRAATLCPRVRPEHGMPDGVAQLVQCFDISPHAPSLTAALDEMAAVRTHGHARALAAGGMLTGGLRVQREVNMTVKQLAAVWRGGGRHKELRCARSRARVRSACAACSTDTVVCTRACVCSVPLPRVGGWQADDYEHAVTQLLLRGVLEVRRDHSRWLHRPGFRC